VSEVRNLPDRWDSEEVRGQMEVLRAVDSVKPTRSFAAARSITKILAGSERSATAERPAGPPRL
jgi:hypothetical protein